MPSSTPSESSQLAVAGVSVSWKTPYEPGGVALPDGVGVAEVDGDCVGVCVGVGVTVGDTGGVPEGVTVGVGVAGVVAGAEVVGDVVGGVVVVAATNIGSTQ